VSAGAAAGTGPLAGIRIVELAGIGPTPFAATMLAELGADVVRVDRPGEANPLALQGGLRRSRASIAVDMKQPAGLAVVQRLIDASDVLIEGYRPGVAERLGLGPQECLQRNPGLVYARQTGWGQTGPLADRAGHDLTYAAISGTLHAIGTRERPVVPPPLIGDFAGGGLYLVIGVLAALQARQSTGAGQVVDAAMVEGSAHLVALLHSLMDERAWRDQRQANLLDGGAPFYDVYECADGKFVAVSALEPQFWAELVSILQIEPAGAQYDLRTWDAQRAQLAETFASRSRDEWAVLFEDSDACVAPVLSLKEAQQHPHLVARGTFAQFDGRTVPVTPPRFSATPSGPPTSEPSPGEDTRTYLIAHGFDSGQVDALIAAGVLAGG
jgi:alpha-methylacyl-CoA racemase